MNCSLVYTLLFMFVASEPGTAVSIVTDAVDNTGLPFAIPGSNLISMRFVLAVLLWCILLVMCWPLALALMFVLPVLWVITLPFMIVGFTLGVVFKIISAIFLFPFRIMGVR